MEASDRSRTCTSVAVALLMATLIAARANSDGRAVYRFSPIGGEFQINTYTTGPQWHGAVAADLDGDFGVVWESLYSDTDLSWTSIQGQLYASDGSPVGGQFEVNSYTTDFQDKPAVAVGVDGDFVVVWHSYGSTGTDSWPPSVQARRYGSDGAALGVEFQVNTYTTSNQRYASVAVSGDGAFVVAWQSFGSGGTDSSDTSIQGRRFDSEGNPLGGDFQVNTLTDQGQGTPAVAVGADGDFVVVWHLLGHSPGLVANRDPRPALFQ